MREERLSRLRILPLPPANIADASNRRRQFRSGASMSLEDGIWIQSVVNDGEYLADSRRRDGVIRTQARDTRILFGFSNSFSSTVALSSSGAAFSGDLTVDGGRLVVRGLDVSASLAAANAAIDGIRAGSGVGVQAGSVGSNAIADSNVTPQKIYGVLPVSVGGTGAPAGSFPAGAIPFGASGAAEALRTMGASLAFEASTGTLAASNANFRGSVRVESGLVTGAPGDVRYRLRVGSNADRDLVMTRIAADGAEAEYINFGDVRRLLDNIGVV